MFNTQFWSDKVMPKFQGILSATSFETESPPVEKWWSDISSHPPLHQPTIEEVNAMNEAAIVQYLNTSAKLEDYSRLNKRIYSSNQRMGNPTESSTEFKRMPLFLNELRSYDYSPEQPSSSNKNTPKRKFDTEVNPSGIVVHDRHVNSGISRTQEKRGYETKSKHDIWGSLYPNRDRSGRVEVVQFLYSNPPLKSKSINFTSCLKSAFSPNDGSEKQIDDFIEALKSL